jgi:hypothetical protein
MTFAIKVTERNGKEHYLCDRFTETPSRFPSRHAAERQVQFMRAGNKKFIGLEIVKYPAEVKVS